MKLIQFSYRCDYGHDWYLQVLFTQRWALFQASISWCEHPAWPYIQVKSGTGSLFNVMFWVHKLGFDIGFMERTWNWGHLKEEEE